MNRKRESTSAKRRRTDADLKRELAAACAERDEALAQQAAAAEVLEVINSSSGDLAPVFDAMLEKAMRLCGAGIGVLQSYDGNSWSTNATRGVPAAYAEFRKNKPPAYAHPGTGPARILAGERVVHIADLKDEDAYRKGEPNRRALVDLGGARTSLLVAMVKDNRVLGFIQLYNKEVRPFTDKQIALLQNFAAQAVIAMENARLLGDLRERTDDLQQSLEYQTAISDVLKVISGSGFELAPVFQTVVSTAVRLCRADQATIYRLEDGEYRWAAGHSLAPDYERIEQNVRIRPGTGTLVGRVALNCDTVEILDAWTDPLYEVKDDARVGGVHTMLGVPLLRDGLPIGVIGLARRRIEAYDDREIALVRTFADQAVIAIENARLVTETREALEQQTATAEVLGVINSSPGDLTPVFDAMLEKAHTLCDAAHGHLTIYDGGQFRAVATQGVPPAFAELLREPFRPGLDVADRLLAGRDEFIHIPDMAAVTYDPDDRVGRAAAEVAGVRTLLIVPLRKDGVLLGYITAHRTVVRPFTDQQIALLQNFAAQAVIAMENARLLTETREALDQQTATAEVLGVINASPGNLAPVFDAILDKAHRLCDATRGTLFLLDGETFRAAAMHGYPPPAEGTPPRTISVSEDPRLAALLAGERLIHVPDLTQVGDTIARAVAERGGVRTNLLLPLRREGTLLGVISCNRQEVRPFSDKQIALLQNFAAQAVVAMENARLITETREALEQQTATAEVLGVINSSPGDLTPVFGAMLEKAMRLCGIALGTLQLHENGNFRAVAVRGVAVPLADLLRQPIEPLEGTPPSRLLAGERFVQIEDMAEFARRNRADPRGQAVAAEGLHTVLFVPLRKHADLLGYIAGFRDEVRLFTDKEIALVENFAAQAVIAIENARLITETREALEQQTATAEVLGVINSSPGNLEPVFDAMLERAMRLCGAAFGILQVRERDRFRTAATHGVPTAFAEFRRQNAPIEGPGTLGGRIMVGERVVHVLDLQDDEPYRSGDANRRALVDLGGARTGLAVPLVKDAVILGFMIIYRQEVRPFTEKQIVLLQNFAAQAVIAMENARLLGDLRERTDDLQQSLEYQTATSDVLQVISRSAFDLRPVLDTLVETAARLCEADMAFIFRRDGELMRLSANVGFPPDFETFMQANPVTPDRSSITGRTTLDGKVIQIPDIVADPEYSTHETITLGKARTMLGVPLFRQGEVIGVITLSRQRVQPFSERQIELVQTFADQAVIAIENARLITETREALEQQTATAEVLGVINASPGDLGPVFDAMLEKAMRLCEATFGIMNTYDAGEFRTVTLRGAPDALADYLLNSTAPQPDPDSPPGRIISGEDVVQVEDLPKDRGSRGPRGQAMVQLGGARSYVTVALRKDGRLLGSIAAYRPEVRPFSDKQIALLQNFAAQAVIAMDNARLITETREALEQQTATAEVLETISSSPGHLEPVFEAVIANAVRICGGRFGLLALCDGDGFRGAAAAGLSRAPENLSRMHNPPPGTGLQRLQETLQTIQVADCAAEPAYDAVRVANPPMAAVRTALHVPMLKEGALLGAIMVYRDRVAVFTKREVDLVESFAKQAVIAIENARLITETREALEQQTATAEVLGAINSSPGDLAPVFAVMVERAANLCEADEAAVRTFDGELLHLVTTHGTDPSALERLRGLGPTGLTGLYEPFARGNEVVHYFDARETDAYQTHELGRQRIDARGIRSWLAVALRKEGALLGIINVHRRDVRPFSDKQIALLQNFAAQAVIAMENARLLDEIRQRQAELRITFDNMADGVAMFDQELRLTAWNRNFQELLDLPDELLTERPAFDTYIRYLTERGEFGTSDPESEIARLRFRLGDQYSFERTRPDGTVLEVRNNPMPDGGVVVIYSDITDRKRSEEEIRAARDAAEAAYTDLQAAQSNLVQAQKMAALGQLTAGIAHEIKNPLNFVNNFASLSVELLDELKVTAAPALATLDEDKRADVDDTMGLLTGNLEKIAEHGKRADNIVKSMLEHSRGVSGERREVDLNGVIEEALNLAYHGARAQDQSFNITLERDYAEGLTAIELAPQEMTRVFLNLFGNGFYAANKRARDNGDGSFRPVLSVRTRDEGDAVEIRVRDNGTGIPAEIKEKLFQPFFTTKPTGEGTGLGLSISYDIITQQHGGTITVESEPGAYTEFTVRLPRH